MPEFATILAYRPEIGQGNYAMIESVRAIAAAGIPLVPQILAGGADGAGEGNQPVNMIMPNLLTSHVEKKTAAKPGAASAAPDTGAPPASG